MRFRLLLPRAASSLLALAALAALATTNAACVSKPTMHLNHAEISGFQMATYAAPPSVVMTVVVDVFNPNGYDVAIRAMRGQVMMAGKYSVPVDYRAPEGGVWLAAGKTTQMRTPIAIPLDLAIALVREAFQSPTIGYRMIGKADVTGTRTLQVEKDDYAVDEQGSITRDQMIAIIPNTLLGPH